MSLFTNNRDDSNVKNDDSEKPLHSAAAKLNNTETVRLFTNTGADSNVASVSKFLKFVV